MSKKCVITGKKPMVANHVSHAHNKTKRRQLPNLQKKRFWLPEEKRWIRLRLTTRAIRTIDKKGLKTVLREAGIKV